MRGRAKVGDGNSHESYSSKASKVKDHTVQGQFIRLGPILRICSSAKSTPAQFKMKEKFGYLLEMVRTQGNKKNCSLKPGTLRYKTAWKRLQKEYGQTKLVVNAYMEEIINLTPVKGYSFQKVRDLYERLAKNYDALQTLSKGTCLGGL